MPAFAFLGAFIPFLALVPPSLAARLQPCVRRTLRLWSDSISPSACSANFARHVQVSLRVRCNARPAKQAA